MEKKNILEIESVYTANAFQIGKEAYVAAGSETTPQVYLYNMCTGKSELVSGCPGGVMSFVPVPGMENIFSTTRDPVIKSTIRGASTVMIGMSAFRNTCRMINGGP